MSASIYFEKLKDRDLWVDGESSLHVDALANRILEGEFHFLEKDMISESCKNEVKKFVSLIDSEIPTKVRVKSKESIKELNSSFNIPEKQLELDINKLCVNGLKKRHSLKEIKEDELERRLYRIADELELYNSMGLIDVLKCANYIVETFKKNRTVWGPGRGSACCSYILYLLEVHDIDSYAFDLSIDEFLR